MNYIFRMIRYNPFCKLPLAKLLYLIHFLKAHPPQSSLHFKKDTEVFRGCEQVSFADQGYLRNGRSFKFLEHPSPRDERRQLTLFGVTWPGADAISTTHRHRRNGSSISSVHFHYSLQNLQNVSFCHFELRIIR